jgi:hypothetical protein
MHFSRLRDPVDAKHLGLARIGQPQFELLGRLCAEGRKVVDLWGTTMSRILGRLPTS